MTPEAWTFSQRTTYTEEKKMRKALTFSFLLALVAATAVFAIGEARLTGKVTDAEGKPLSDVAITVTSGSAAKTYNAKAKTDSKGNFTIFLLDGTIPYKFSFAKEGFAGYEIGRAHV